MTDISIIVGSRNRTEFLLQSITSWLEHDLVKEIIIVDFGSDQKIEFSVDPRIRIYRINNVDQWILSIALNFAAEHASYPLLLKLDADSVLNHDFFTCHPLCPSNDMFYSGNWRIARDTNERHLNGILFIPRLAFMESGGYNEYIRTYGYDDTDLYVRLKENGLVQKDISPDSVRHLVHSNEIRYTNPDLKFEIIKNMHLSKIVPWHHGISHTQFVQQELCSYIIQDIDLNKPSEEIIAQAETQALVTILVADHNYPSVALENKHLKFLSKLYQSRNKHWLIIEPKNGLGNRLRALASAVVIAEALDLVLCIIWKADSHCQARFGDIFDAQFFLVFETDIIRKSYPVQKINYYPNHQPKPVTDLCEIKDCHHSYPSIIQKIEHQPGFMISTDIDVHIISSCNIKHRSTSWSKENHWMRTWLKPIPDIQQTIDAKTMEYDITKCIGIHIRMGQSPKQYSYEQYFNWDISSVISLQKNRKVSHYNFFMEEIDRIWEQNPNQKFFLCADNEYIYKAFQDRYPEMLDSGSRIVYLPKTEYDRSMAQISSAIVDVYLLSKTMYILGSQWSTFTELALRLGCCRAKYAGLDFVKKKYGAMLYQNSYNLGDNIQTLAVLQYLNKKVPIDEIFWIDRDNIKGGVYDYQGNLVYGFDNFPYSLYVPMNGWFDGRLTKWPLPTKIIPLLVSVHVNESEYILKDAKYRRLISQMENTSLFDNDEKINYFYESAPIGCRDSHTLSLFQQYGIPSFYSGCLTLTLKPDPTIQRTDKILIVDSHLLFPDFLKKYVPKQILDRAEYRTQALNKMLPNDTKLQLAKSLLSLYQTCRLVITSRLHCALPCLAFGIPIVFIYPDILEDVRFDPTLVQILGLTETGHLPDNPIWEAITITETQQRLITQIRTDLEFRINKFLN